MMEDKIMSMKSWLEKGLEEAEKQKHIDEIHMWPEVKKTFTICEIFFTIDWISNILFLALLALGIWHNALDYVMDLSTLAYLLLDHAGFTVIAVALIVIKIVVGRVKKSYRAKLEVLEMAGFEKIKKQKEEGTYVEGEKPNLAYRIYRAIRTWTTIIVITGLFIVFGIKFF